MELVGLVKDFFDGVYLQELRSTTGGNVSTHIGNLVVKVDITFLTQHANSR